MADNHPNPWSILEPANAADPHAAYRDVRETCPVAHVSDVEQHTVFVLRDEHVRAVLRDPATFSSSMDAVHIGQDRPLIPLQLDPPDHARYRRMLDPHFSAARMAALEDDIRKLVAELVEPLMTSETCDLHAEFTEPLPSTIFVRLMGLPLEDLPTFLEIKEGIVRPDGDTAEEQNAERARAGAAMYEYFGEAIEHRRRHPDDGLFSALITSEIDGRPVTNEEMLDISFLMILAGLDTVTATLDCSFAYLARHADRRRAIVERPEIISSAVEELLRHQTPVQVVLRIVREAGEIGGVEIAPGDSVAVVLGAANTDPRGFHDPEIADFERQPNRHLAFGSGPHRCLGSHLARLELRVALEEFHRRIPDYELEAGTELEFSVGVRQATALPLRIRAAAPVV
ncbi:MAG: cytochrome P450 [Acidimicrobiia bacterium]